MTSENKELIVEVEHEYGTFVKETLPQPDANQPIKYSLGKKYPQYIAAISATLGAFAYGTVLGWISPAVVKMNSEYVFPIMDTDFSWLGSLVFLGAASVFAPIHSILNKIGSKNTMLIFIIPLTIGWLLILFASNIVHLYTGRFLTGFSSGSYLVAIPLYTAEIAQKDIRGGLGTIFQTMITLGIVFAYVVGSLTTITILNGICAGIPLLFGLIFYFQPDSPVFLVRKNRIGEAQFALKKLRGKNYDIDMEVQEIVSAEERNTTHNLSLWQLDTKKALVIGCGLMVFQQLSGFYPIISYSSLLIQTPGLPISIETIIILLGIVQLIANFVSELVIDRKGRKCLLIQSTFWMVVTSLVLGLFYTFQQRYSFNQIPGASMFPVLLISAFAVAFSIGLAPVPWVIMGEIFPADIKFKAASLACTINVLCSFLVTQFFVKMIYTLGKDVTFYIFSIVCMLALLFTKLGVIETKGKTLNEIQNELRNN